jgi:hypothetical protein
MVAEDPSPAMRFVDSHVCPVRNLMKMARLLALLITLALFSSACTSDAETTAGTSTLTADAQEPLHFAAPEGWFTFEGIESNGGEQVAWAANVPFADEDTAPSETWLLPTETTRKLPPDGIVLFAYGPRPYTGNAEYEEHSLPLKLSDGSLATGQYETQLAPNVSLAHTIGTLIDGELLSAQVWFGSNPPSEEMKAEADRVLETLVVPED